MSRTVECSKCEEPMTLTDKGIARMQAEGDSIEHLPFICDDCIKALDYVKEPKR